MQCDLCNKKKATVHLTEIVDEQLTEMHLCEECARQKSVQMEQQFGLADLLAGLTDFNKQLKDPLNKTAALKCSHCGLSYEDFRKLGRLGCGECYFSFKDQLETLLKKIHGSNHHLGKSPIKQVEKDPAQDISKKLLPTTKKKEDFKEDLEDLKKLLQESIRKEDFEKAAHLRDKIRELEKEKKNL